MNINISIMSAFKDFTNEQLDGLMFRSEEQNVAENIRLVKEKFGKQLDDITHDLQGSMAGLINDVYCHSNPNATTPVEGINYQEDTGALVFELDDVSIFMEPVWVPVLYKHHSKFPKNIRKLENVKWASINPIKSDIMYSAGDFHMEEREKEKKIELENMTPEQYSQLPKYKKILFGIEKLKY
jgi:hypothetical protein